MIAAELAKQAATVQELTGGRLTLGLGVGWREADYTLTGRDFAGRGRLFDQQLADLRRAWAGEPILDGTRPAAPEIGRPGVPVLVGGNTDAAIRRTVEHGIGWTAGGVPPEAVAPFVERGADGVAVACLEDAGDDGPQRLRRRCAAHDPDQRFHIHRQSVRHARARILGWTVTRVPHSADQLAAARHDRVFSA